MGGRGNKDGNGLTQYGLLSSKTEGNGNYELYDYDQCNQQISTGYWWADGTGQNALVYSYDPAGNVHSVNQGWYATTYGYDGADQLTSETNANGSSSAPPTVSYTYDHNGNRLTQTQNGSSYQSFTYDAHDKLTSGTAGSESDGYDQNGNETSISINGGVYRLVYDDEDRLTSLTLPSGTMDSFTHNGLGLRVTKTDSTGSYAYLCDGTSPASPMLTDGAALYTPGLSEYRGGASRYYANDKRGNLWTIDASSKGQAYYQDTTGFGTPTAEAGSGSVFGYGGGNGCQSDVDTGLILMGHRYFGTRIGRFITQDPIGDGDNWYAYAGNSPTNEVDPLGLDPSVSVLWTDPDPEDHNPDDGHWDNGDPTGMVGSQYTNESGERDTHWIPNWNFYKYMYTGTPTASQGEYDAALNQGAVGFNNFARHFEQANKYGLGVLISAAAGSLPTWSSPKFKVRPGARPTSSVARKLSVAAGKSALKKTLLRQILKNLADSVKDQIEAKGGLAVGTKFGVGGVAVFEAGAGIWSAYEAWKDNPGLVTDGDQ